ncbi:HAD family hydrolase [Chitinophaga solisilvae]|uniref:HAD family hydrolase n=1 Tax=Chitinophaga solisilvae TaxID=1233460 RepID=UPI001370BB27|nr:HAD family hydrolase [Chitinophaga solisilvae]
MTTIAFFDFDGTITQKDTLWEIIRFHRGSMRMYLGVVKLLPALIRFKLKQLPAQEMKQRVFRYYFGEMTEEDFNAGCADFCRNRLPTIIRPQALTAIRKHQEQGHRIVVVTASAENWVSPWCASLQIGCIGTRLETRDARISGNILGINCNGTEKVNRIRQQFRLEDYQEIFAYGDSEGDKPMLALAHHAAFRPFRDK